jgi:hypothetical protein
MQAILTDPDYDPVNGLGVPHRFRFRVQRHCFQTFRRYPFMPALA